MALYTKLQNYKTTLLIINGKKKEQLEILIDGVVIQQEQSAKLLGLTIEDSQIIGDASRLWNRAPEVIKISKTLCSAKNEIKKFVVTLPI